MTLPVWPYQPDWSSEYRQTYEFKTEVITSRSGKEQRVADRAAPRILVEFDALVADFDFRSMLATMDLNQSNLIMMPDWSRGLYLDAGAASGATTVDVSGTDGWMVPDMEIAFIWGEPGAVEAQQAVIQSVSGSIITLADPLPQDIPADAKVYRLWQGLLATEIMSKMRGDWISQVSVKFDVDPGFEKLQVLPDAPLTYLGRELIVREPNWQEDLGVSFKSAVEVLDYGVGRKAYNRPIAFNDRTVQFSYAAIERIDVLRIRNFFRRLRGQQGEFFMPTFTEDLRLRHTAASGASVLRVIGANVTEAYASSTVYKNIAVLYEDETYDLFAVDSITPISDSAGSDSLLHLSAATTRTIDPDDVRMVCWLPLWRSLSDQLVIQWVTDEVANVGMSLKTLEALGVEA